MDSSVDVVYCEIWPPMTRYRDLSTLIALCRTSGKPVVMACYPKAFRLDEPDRALVCQLLLSSGLMSPIVPSSASCSCRSS